MDKVRKALTDVFDLASLKMAPKAHAPAAPQTPTNHARVITVSESDDDEPQPLYRPAPSKRHVPQTLVGATTPSVARSSEPTPGPLGQRSATPAPLHQPHRYEQHTAAQEQPAAQPAAAAAPSAPRMKWTDAETELLYLLDDNMKELFAEANVGRGADEEPLGPPSALATAMQALIDELPGLKKETLCRRYAAVRKGKLPRPPNSAVPAEYVLAAKNAAEALLLAATVDDANGVGGGKKRRAGGAAEGGEGSAKRPRVGGGMPASMPSAQFVGGRLMPGQVSNIKLNRRLKEEDITLGQARKLKTPPHKSQWQQFALLHDCHQFYTWYEATREVCLWGGRNCQICKKKRQINLYSLARSLVNYFDKTGKHVNELQMQIKYMCQGCALDNVD